MISKSFLNPLSDEGKDIASEEGILDSVFDENDQLKKMVIKINPAMGEEEVPRSYADFAIKRIEWYTKKRNRRNYREYVYLFDKEIANKILKFDVIAFYLLCQAIGVKFGPNSRESRFMIESQGKLVEDRLYYTIREEDQRKNITRQIIDEISTETIIKWMSLVDLLSSRKIYLRDLILDKGEVILSKKDFMERFTNKIENRNPERMYDLLVGDKVKELIMIKMIMQVTENYIKKVHEMSRNIEPHPSLLEIGNRISEVLSEPTKYYGGRVEVKASQLNPDAFPPCIKKIMKGVGSGMRNDAIVLLLTSFLSYARLYPGVFSKNVTMKISDLDPNLDIVQNEILPLIYEAAERCNPPLFDDQPQEKININAKLGFGMHENLSVEHEGESKWYTPMSCEKVKIHLYSICKPDEMCKKIGNPLIYYSNKLKDKSKKSKKL